MNSPETNRSKSRKTASKSSKEKGDEFEGVVADVFRCIPGTTVSSHVKIGGKDVDLLVTVQRPFSPNLRIVVDAKDYDRVISRDRASAEFSNYYPLVASRHADQFMLVTRKGIVANAKEIFDGTTAIHYTISELGNLVVDPRHLVNNMETQFSLDGLNGYYVETKCYNIDMPSAVKNYDFIYGEFLSFCISEGLSSLDAGKDAWVKCKGVRGGFLPAECSEEMFRGAMKSRRRSLPLKDLEPIVWSWLSDQSHNLQLALLGTYGTGKSSFARKIAYRAAVDFKAGRSDRIPLLIELRDFGSHQSIEGLITNTLINKHGISNGSYALFQKMNSMGRYFIILDGFDEMKQGMTRDALIYNFSQLNALCVGRSKVMLCGRPTMFESEEEQVAILTGSSTTDLPSRAKYISLEIAPLEQDSIFELIAAYSKVHEPKEGIDVTSKLHGMHDKIQSNAELLDLLSRPVHIPMFVTILPDFASDISELSRGFLYETFIRKIIMREVLRLPQAYQHRYTTEQRLEFVGSLAFEMAKRGEARSIRRSEIPPNIVSPFVNQGESIEIASRDLVAACFLEQKPPDILSFGHKSFLEFLTARYLLSRLRARSAGSSAELIYPTREIGSFIIDLCSSEDLSSALKSSWESREFMVSCLLESVSELWFSPRRILRSHIPSRETRLMRFTISEKTRSNLRHFASPECILALSRSEMSAQLRHVICLILYLGSSELQVSLEDSGQSSSLDTTYSEQTWESIREIAASGEASSLVARWRREVKELLTSLPMRPRSRKALSAEKAYHEHMEFLSSHHRQAFGYYAQLALISTKNH